MAIVGTSGGRSSVSGLSVTVFGASGFVGRYLINRLGQIGSQIVIPFRGNDGDVNHLRPMADLGRIYPLPFDLRSERAIYDCVKDSNVVINLIAQDRNSFNFKMRDVNVEGALRIAKVCKDAGVSKLIHVSSLLADHSSPSAFLRTKAEGEESLKTAFPQGQTIIVRPSSLFGHEDRLLNLIGVFSASPFGYPTVDKGQTKRSPLYVGDLAEAILRLAQKEGDQFKGKTFDLIGDRSYSMQELIQYFAKVTLREHKIVDMPPWAMLLYSRMFPEWRRPVYTRDSIRQLYADEPDKVAQGHLGFKDLGIEKLQSLEELSLHFLRGFRPTYAFARP